jgi:hypothetical protein
VKFRNPNSIKEGGAMIKMSMRAKDKLAAIAAAKAWMVKTFPNGSWVCVTFP